MYIFRFVCVLAIAILPLKVVFAESIASGVVISEMQTGSSSSGSHEFVELYNPTTSPVDVSSWTIEYKSASSADSVGSWTKKASLTGSVPALGFYLVAPSSYLVEADASWTVGLASSGGNIRLKDGGGTVVDQLGYGETANAAETQPADAPPAGQSLERLPGWKDEHGGNAVDTGDNSADFGLRTSPQPQSAASPIEVPSAFNPEEPVEEESPDEQEQTPAPISFPKILITELLIDPQAPLTDAEDEFVELFNPGAEPAVITGYKLRAGTNFNDEYLLPETTVGPGEYMVFHSIDSRLSLVNAGGAVQIIDPNGEVVDQTDSYPQAEPGVSWALTDGSWDWTLQSTPGAANVFVAPLVATSSPKASAPKKAAAVKKPAAKKVTAKKAATLKQPKETKVKAAAATKAVAPEAKNFQPANWLIALLIGLTITYAIYEFRYDIQNLYRRCRSYNRAR